VATLAFLVVVLVVMTMWGAGSAATSDPGAPVPTRAVEVAEGDTLWGIAVEVAPPGQVRETVHRIKELNGLSGSGIVEGQRLAVPTQ
jgi:hypothetical protein